jgi:polyphosphate kinase
VELLCRVTDADQQAELRSLIGLAMDESTSSWWLDADGTWVRHHLDSDGKPLRDLQQYLIQTRRVRSVSLPDADG